MIIKVLLSLILNQRAPDLVYRMINPSTSAWSAPTLGKRYSP